MHARVEKGQELVEQSLNEALQRRRLILGLDTLHLFYQQPALGGPYLENASLQKPWKVCVVCSSLFASAADVGGLV